MAALAALGALVTAGSLSAAPVGQQFQPYQAISVGSSPAAVAVGDVTGDGRSDILSMLLAARQLRVRMTRT